MAYTGVVTRIVENNKNNSKETLFDRAFNNDKDGNDDLQPDEENTFEYGLLQDYFEGNLVLHWNLTKSSEARMTYILTINIYKLLMSIHMHINMFSCFTWSSEHGEHSLHWKDQPHFKNMNRSSLPSPLLNLQTVQAPLFRHCISLCISFFMSPLTPSPVS